MKTWKTMIANIKKRFHFVTRRLAVSSLPLALLCSASPAISQEKSQPTADGGAPALRVDLRRVEGALAGMVADGRAAGASVLVWKDGREVYFGRGRDGHC
jgi:hypothetical protein